MVGQLCHRVQGSQQAVLLCAVAGVCTGSKRGECGTAIGQSAGVLAVHHVGGDGQDRGGSLRVAVGVALLDHLQEGAQQPHADLVGAVIIVAVLGEVALGLKAGGKAALVTHYLHLGVLDGAQGVDDVGEACNAGGKGAAHVGVDKGHLGFLIVVFVVHILDQVQHIDVQASQPVQHLDILGQHLVVVQVLAGDGGIVGAALLVALLVHTAVDGVQQALGQVGAGTEELHLLAGLGGRHAAADGVVIAPHGLHHVVVLVLDAAGVDGHLGGVLFKGLRQGGGVQHRQVRLRGGAHVLQGVEEAVAVLGDHAAAVHADAAHFQGGPHGVAGEQLVVAGDAGELDHAELHDHVVDELLSLALGQDALVQIALDIDVEEGGDAAHAHSGAVLGLDGGQIAEVQPLAGFLGGLCRLRDIIAVGLGHLLHALQGADLAGDLLAQADHVVGHGAVAAVGKVLLLELDQCIDAVQGHAAVVAHDAAAAISVRQAGDDMGVAGRLHLRSVGIKHSLIVGAGIIGKDLVQLGAGLVAVGGAGLLCHLDAAVGHEGALEGLVGLQTHDLLQILQAFVDIAGAVSSQAADHFGLHIQHAALGALGLLQLLQGPPQLVGRLGGAGQKAFVAVIRGVVLLDEVAHIDFFFPDAALKAFPLFKIDHWNLLAPFHALVSMV